MKSILNTKWKVAVVSIPFVVGAFYLFIRYVPWLFGSKPIAVLEYSDVSNKPAPEWAFSFAINHGKAMYFQEPIPSEAPALAWTVSIIFSIVFLILCYLGGKLKKLDNVT